MRPNNSLGGYRIYPTSPAYAEEVESGIAILGQFNESMDHLNRECELTQRQQQLLNTLDPTSQLAKSYHSLRSSSDALWQLAFEKQRQIDQQIVAGPYTTLTLCRLFNQCSNQWKQLKRQLDEHA